MELKNPYILIKVSSNLWNCLMFYETFTSDVIEATTIKSDKTFKTLRICKFNVVTISCRK